MTVAAGFEDRPFVTGIASPSTLAFAPDGRLFVGEKATGRIRIVRDGQLLPVPFLDLTTLFVPPERLETASERGLLGIAFDPAFAVTPWVYVYYTLCKGLPGGSGCVPKNRVERFWAQGDAIDPGVQEIVLDDIASDAGNHNGGWLGFGPLDGKLYVAVGDGGADRRKAQDLGSLSGKVLRVEPDGFPPADNPFVGQAGAREEVWALGFRNPWRCRFDPAGHLFCGDVGNNATEEVDVVVRGGNYGWPDTEGRFDPLAFPDFILPIHTYDHLPGARASITGGDFGVRTRFPEEYRNAYFLGDFVRGTISRAVLDETGTGVVGVEDFVTGIGGASVTDLVVGPDGDLYYAVYSPPAVRRVSPAEVEFTVITQPDGLEVLIDDEPQAAPVTLAGLFGSSRTLSAPSPQHLGGETWVFVGWSDGGGQTHGIRIPAVPETFVATFLRDTTSTSTTSSTVPTTTSSTSSTASTSTTTSSSLPPSSTTGSSMVPTTTTSATLATSTTASSTATSSTATTSTATSTAASSTATSSTVTSSTATSTTAASSTSTTLGATCAPGCDDGDACTDDGCAPQVGCTHAEKQAADAAGVTCHVENLRRLLHATQSCAGRCFTGFDRGLERVAQRVAAVTSGTARCRRALGAALAEARRLERRARRLARSGTEQTAALRDQATHLREGVMLLRATRCPRRAR